MITKFKAFLPCFLFVFAFSFICPEAKAFDDMEEPAGVGFLFLFNPADEIFGASGNAGMRVTDTPFYGDYFAQIFWNGIEDSMYTGVGLTVRIMPNVGFAPFIGLGGAYNYSLKNNSDGEDDGSLADKGASYWSGHIEAGVRFLTRGRWNIFEILARYCWSSLEGDRDTVIFAIGSKSGQSSLW